MKTNYKRLLQPCSWKFVALCLYIGIPGLSHAVSVGDANVQSYLDQPLKVEIPLANTSLKELEGLDIGLAPAAAFGEFGYEVSPVLADFRFEIIPGPGSTGMLRITTLEPVSEPFLAFMLSIRTIRAAFVRGYTLLLDPVEYPTHVARARPAPPVQRPLQPVPAPPPMRPAPVAQAMATAEGDLYGPVRSGQTLSQIAAELRPGFGVTNAQMTWGLFQTNPAAFIDNNANALKTDVYLKLPSAERLAQASPREAVRALAIQADAWRKRVSLPSGEVSLVEAEMAATPEADRNLAAQTTTPEIGFDLAPRFKFEQTRSTTPTTIPADTRLSQLLDPTAKVAVATDTAGPDERHLGTPEAPTSETPANSVQPGVMAPPSAPQPLATDVDRLEKLVNSLQDQLSTREQQITGLEQRLEDMTTTINHTLTTSRSSLNFFTPLNIVLALLVLAVGALLGWLIARRDKPDRVHDYGDTGVLYDRAITPPEEESEPHFTAPEETKPATPLFTSLSTGVDETEEIKEALGIGTEFLTGELRDSELAMKVSETDVLDELELYINGGYYNDAKNLLIRLVDKEPNNTDFRLQLLRVLRILGEGDEFIRQAKLTRATLEDSDGSIWEDIRRMGVEIRPSEPLFADDYLVITEEAEETLDEDDHDGDDHFVEFKS
jgi:pilus assembly protein FimV